jgi:hypothetical protein
MAVRMPCHIREEYYGRILAVLGLSFERATMSDPMAAGEFLDEATSNRYCHSMTVGLAGFINILLDERATTS